MASDTSPLFVDFLHTLMIAAVAQSHQQAYRLKTSLEQNIEFRMVRIRVQWTMLMGVAVIVHTPCTLSHTLSKLCNMQVYFKKDIYQHTGSFKERGARNALKMLTYFFQSSDLTAAVPNSASKESLPHLLGIMRWDWPTTGNCWASL